MIGAGALRLELRPEGRSCLPGHTGGVLPGAAPTGKPFGFTGLYLRRVIDGRWAELWQEVDRLRLVQQLGSQAGAGEG